MSAKTPIRTVFDGSNNATGLAEFQSGEFINYNHGGTGLTSLGTAGQVLVVNSGASALEYQTLSQTITLAADSGSNDTYTTGETLTFSGDTGITTTVSNNEITIDLDNTAVSAGSYGSSTAIPTFTVDATGRLTAASTASISSTLTIVDDSSTSMSISLGNDTLKVAGTSNEIETSISGDTLTIGLPDNVTIAGNLTVQGTTTTIDSSTISVTSSFTFEGATADAHETTLTVEDPTADRTVTIPNATGQIVLRDTTDTLTNKSIDLANNTLTGSLSEFNTALQSESFVGLAATQTLTNKTLTTPVIASLQQASGSNTLTMPAATDTLVGKATTDTLTNKTINANNNTLSNIANSSLTNSAITINGTSISLGSSGTIVAGTDWQAVKTSNFTAAASEGYFVDTTSGAITATLPASPSLGDEVRLLDLAGTFDTNNLTIGRNSKKIQGLDEDLVVSTENAAIGLVFTNDTYGWRLIENL